MFTKQNIMLAAVVVTAYLVWTMYRNKQAAAAVVANPGD